jgi:hypothetical protein
VREALLELDAEVLHFDEVPEANEYHQSRGDDPIVQSDAPVDDADADIEPALA